MKLEVHPIEEPAKLQEPYHQATGDNLHPERITEKCYTINFIRNKALSGVSLPHNIRLALSTIANGLDDLNHELQFIRPILKGCPDYDETKTKYYLQQNVGKSAPYSCEKLKEIIHDHFNELGVQSERQRIMTYMQKMTSLHGTIYAYCKSGHVMLIILDMP